MVGRHLSSELCSCPLFKDIQVWWYMCVMPVLRATAGDPEFEASLSPKTEVRYKHPKLALFTFLGKEGNHTQLCHLRLGFVQSGLGVCGASSLLLRTKFWVRLLGMYYVGVLT